MQTASAADGLSDLPWTRATNIGKQRTDEKVTSCIYEHIKELRRRILVKLLNIFVSQATSSLSTQQSANVLSLLDEFHRHASSGRLEDDSEADRLRSLLHNMP